MLKKESVVVLGLGFDLHLHLLPSQTTQIAQINLLLVFFIVAPVVRIVVSFDYPFGAPVRFLLVRVVVVGIV